VNRSTLSVFAGLFGLSFVKSKSGNSNESNYTATVHLNYKIENISGTDIDGYFVVERNELLMNECFDLASAWNNKYPISENTLPFDPADESASEYLDKFVQDVENLRWAWRDYLEDYFSWYVDEQYYDEEVPFIVFFKKFFYNEKFDVEIKDYQYKRSEEPENRVEHGVKEDYDISVTLVFKNIKSPSPQIYAQIYKYILDFINEEYNIVYSYTGGVEFIKSIQDISIEDNFPPRIRAGKVILNSLNKRSELRRF